MAYIYDLTDTWNASGTTFNGIKLNVTDSASASSSKLVTLQTNGTEHFSITKAGVGYVSGNLGVGVAPSGTYGKLTVAGGMRTAEDSNSKLEIGRYSSGAPNSYIKLSPNSASLRFTNAADDTDLMTLTNAGNLGIGTSSISPYSSSYRALLIDGGANPSSLQLNNSTTGSGTNSGGLALIQSGNDSYIWNPKNSFLSFGTNNAERMRIDASGNVGIGTSSPAGKLHVSGSEVRLQGSASFYSFYDTAGTTRSGYFQNNAGSIALVGELAQPMTFWTSNAERMRIDSSGNLLVGTTAEDANIGGSSGTGMQFSARVGFGLRSSINTDVHYWNKYPTGDLHQFRCAGVAVGSISVTGSATAYNTSSDARLKHDIVDAPEASDLIDAIQVRSFKWNVDDSEQRYGFIAQELVEVAPEAVHQPEDPDATMGVDYSKLVPMLVKELQSLRARVAELEGK